MLYLQALTFANNIVWKLKDFLSSSAVAKLANTWGRKKMYVSLATIDAISSFLVVISINGTTLFSVIILIGGFLVGLCGGYEMALLPATMMIVDTTDPSTRFVLMNATVFLDFFPSDNDDLVS